MFILINNRESLIQNITWVNKFEAELYIPNFPNENEREPFENIKQRILNNDYPTTTITLLIEDDKLIGGCVIDSYIECKSIEPIYLVVNKEMRNRGYGRKLLDVSITNMENIKHVFLEVDDPQKPIDESNITIDPQKRLNMYLNWGFKVLNFNYIQPPLSENSISEENLLLLYRGEILEKNNLKDFLYYFYKGLNAEDSDDLNKMFNEIDNMEILFRE